MLNRSTIDSSTRRKRPLQRVWSFLWVVCFPIVWVGDVTAAQRSNVLVIITDDQGYGDLSRHGNPVLKTPNLDRLPDRYRASLRAALEAGLRENALVVFLTDNGSTFGPRYFNAGMTGGKVTLWKGGHRVPCFVRWPAARLRPAGDVAGLGLDLLPTLIELLNLTLPPGGQFDSVSLAQALRASAEVPDDRKPVINHSRMPFNAVRTMPESAAVPRRDGAAVLWRRWRLLEDRQLYDLAADPLQQRNVIEDHPEIAGAYYVTAERLRTVNRPVALILDTDMSGDADDAGTLALLHALADRGECELLATVTNRKDKTNASAAAVDAINTYYGRPDIPIGTDKQGPTDLQRTSLYTEALRDGFPNDIGPDDQAPDALDVYRQVLAGQEDGSVTVCSVGALSNLAELCQREPELVRAKVRRLVVMGGEFPDSNRPETNIRTHREAAQVVAAQWPGEIIWHGFEIGQVLITGEQLKWTPRDNPVRRAYELRQHRGRPSIEGGQPSYDQAAALFAVRGAEPEFWEIVTGGRVLIDAEGLTVWRTDPAARHAYVRIAGDPQRLAAEIESLMVAEPRNKKGTGASTGKRRGNE